MDIYEEIQNSGGRDFRCRRSAGLRFPCREMGKKLTQVLDTASELHLVTEGNSIFLEDQHARILDLRKDARQPILLVCVCRTRWSG